MTRLLSWLGACLAFLALSFSAATQAQSNASFSHGVAFNGSQATLWFKSTVATTWVDAHYQLNGGAQQNLRMPYNSAAARHERHVALQGARQEIGGVDLHRQRRPDEQPALGLRPRRLGREVLGQGPQQRVAPPAVQGLQGLQVGLPLALAEVLRHEVLGHRRRAEVGALLAEVHLLQHRRGRDGPPEAQPAEGLAIDFVVEADRAQLDEIVQRVRDGRVRTVIGDVASLDDAVTAFNRTERAKGKTIVRVRP